MFEKEKERCFAGIKKCDEFLKNFDVYVNQQSISSAKVPPEEAVIIFKVQQKNVADDSVFSKFYSDLNLAIFYANAKQGFIMRLVAMQEAEECY